MNLATARSTRRAREVGLRKVVWITSRTTYTSVSFRITVFHSHFSYNQHCHSDYSYCQSLTSLQASHSIFMFIYSPVVLLSLLGVIIIVGIFGGSYPAFFLSRFSPVTVLKGEITQGSAGSLFRKDPCCNPVYCFSYNDNLYTGSIQAVELS